MRRPADSAEEEPKPLPKPTDPVNPSVVSTAPEALVPIPVAALDNVSEGSQAQRDALLGLYKTVKR